MNNPVVHFEIPANDVKRAKKFYEKLFGWEIERMPMPDGDYYGVRTTPVGKDKMPKLPGAINGGMMERKNPSQPFMNYIHVESIDKMIPAIEKAGGRICMPKTEIGKGMGWIACFQDTEENMMGLHEMGKAKK